MEFRSSFLLFSSKSGTHEKSLLFTSRREIASVAPGGPKLKSFQKSYQNELELARQTQTLAIKQKAHIT